MKMKTRKSVWLRQTSGGVKSEVARLLSKSSANEGKCSAGD